MIDDQTLGSPSGSTAILSAVPSIFQASRKSKVIDDLRRQSDLAVQDALTREAPLPMVALSVVATKYHLPKFYIDELLAGMAMDVEGRRYETFADLLTYCYRVAGTVGLLFAHISGVSDPNARRHAAELGIAMQLTNIARDVAADWCAGRIYLPLTWLAEERLSPQELLGPASRDRLFAAVQRLLAEADVYYKSGDEGLRYLPLRAAIGVAAARKIYADIGRNIQRRGTACFESRTTVTSARKMLLVLAAFWQVARGLVGRYKRPWRAANLEGIWRLT